MNNKDILKRAQMNKENDEREVSILKDSILIANKATTIIIAIVFIIKSVILKGNAWDLIAIMFGNCGILYTILFLKLQDKSYLLKALFQLIGVVIFFYLFIKA